MHQPIDFDSRSVSCFLQSPPLLSHTATTTKHLRSLLKRKDNNRVTTRELLTIPCLLRTDRRYHMLRLSCAANNSRSSSKHHPISHPPRALMYVTTASTAFLCCVCMRLRPTTINELCDLTLSFFGNRYDALACAEWKIKILQAAQLLTMMVFSQSTLPQAAASTTA